MEQINNLLFQVLYLYLVPCALNPILLIFVKTCLMAKELSQRNDIEDPGESSDELYERMNINVDRGQEPFRLDKFLVARMENASRNKIQQAIEAGRILVNNKIVQPNYKIRPSDNIIIYSEKQVHGEEIIPEKIPL